MKVSDKVDPIKFHFSAKGESHQDAGGGGGGFFAVLAASLLDFHSDQTGW